MRDVDAKLRERYKASSLSFADEYLAVDSLFTYEAGNKREDGWRPGSYTYRKDGVRLRYHLPPVELTGGASKVRPSRKTKHASTAGGRNPSWVPAQRMRATPRHSSQAAP